MARESASVRMMCTARMEQDKILFEGGVTMYCRYCGKTVPEDSDFCDACGRRLKGGGTETTERDASIPPDSATDAEIGVRNDSAADLEAGTVRCPNPNCGYLVRNGRPICPACGAVLPAKEQQEAAAYLTRKVREIEKNYNPGKILFAPLLLVVLAFLMYFFIIPQGLRLDDFIMGLSFGEWALVTASLGWLILVIIGMRKRAKAIKKLGLTPQQYGAVLWEQVYHKRQIARVVYRTPDHNKPGDTNPTAKIPGKAGARLMRVIMSVLCLTLGLMAANYITDGAVYAFLDGAAGSGGASVSGRWEATSGGSYDPAIVFRNGKAYFGIIGLSDEDIINDVGGIRQKADRDGVSYTVTSTSITFKSNVGGITTTYKRSKDAIYFGPATLKKVASKP